MILVKINHPCLRVRCHSWYQSHYGYNTSRTVLFLKTAVRMHVDAHIRTIVVLIGGKLTAIYFLYLLFVTTHLRQGKKVSILPPGDVNSGPVPSR
jgi:cytochrome c biogenesis protein ResB